MAVVVTVFFALCSANLNYLNRFIYQTRTPPFDFPGIVEAVQAVVLGLLTMLGLRTRWYGESRTSDYWPSNLGFKSLGRLLGFGVCYAFDISMTQQAESHAPVALVELVKSAIPAVVMALTACYQRQCPHWIKSICVFAICLGVGLATQSGGVAQGVRPGGFLFSILAALAGGIRLFVTQLLLQGEHQCPKPLLLMYFSPMLFLSGCLSFYLKEVSTAWGFFNPLPEALSPANRVTTCVFLLLDALVACALNYSEFSVMQATSALIITLVGALKLVAMILLSSVDGHWCSPWCSVALTGHPLSPWALTGAAISITGVAVYKYADKTIHARPIFLASSPDHLEPLLLS